MKVDTNPFFLRASEYTGLDDNFIKLFSPDVLNVLSKDNLWKTIQVIRSAPGGGKTTLLKIFQPSVLATIRSYRRYDEHINELFKILKEIGALTENASSVIGTLIAFTADYSSLEYLEASQPQKIRTFYSLLNARITVAFLRALSFVKNNEFPEELHKVYVDGSSVHLPPGVPLKGSGLDYYNWACDLEQKISFQIDSVIPAAVDYIGHDELFTLKLFAPANITVNGEPLKEKVLIMLDDVHNLLNYQRERLLQKIIEMRPPTQVWISERLQALTMKEIFSNGNIEERDFSLIDLEHYWNTGKKFEDFAKSVANLRVESASDSKLTNFAGCLPTNFDNDPKVKESFTPALETVKFRVKDEFGNASRYKKWFESKENNSSSEYDQLVSWRSLEILLHRDKKNRQKTFDFVELNEEELTDQEGSDVKEAAKLFLNREFKTPYYYGFGITAKLASFNIEQFLSIAGDLFEEILSASIFKYVKGGHRLEINPSRQEEILRNIAKQRWKSMHTRIPNFENVKPFLEGIAAMCKQETYQPNAPISPGVNGVAILMAERNYLRDTVLKDPKHPLYKLAQCISICISYNLLEYRLNYRCKGKEWMVLYLNRIFCIKNDLPLNYGGFREKKMKDLAEWIDVGFKPKASLWNVK